MFFFTVDTVMEGQPASVNNDIHLQEDDVFLCSYESEEDQCDEQISHKETGESSKTIPGE